MQKNFYLTLLAVGIFPFFVNGLVNAKTVQWPLVYWSLELLFWLVIPIFVVSTARRKGGLRFADIGLHGRGLGRQSVALLALACLVFAPLFLFVYKHVYAYAWSVFPSTPYFSYRSVVPESGALRLAVVIYLAVTAGVVEEIYFRGLMFRTAEFFSRPLAVYLVASPPLFALIHWEGGWANVLATYVVGLLAAMGFVVIRNLWPLIVAHVYTDLVWFS